MKQEGDFRSLLELWYIAAELWVAAVVILHV